MFRLKYIWGALLGLASISSAHPSEDELIALGRSLVVKPWVAAPAATTARDGLGPLFSANSCVACHKKLGSSPAQENARILDRSYIVKLINDGGGDPRYGLQLSPNGTAQVAAEARVRVNYQEVLFRYPDGHAVKLRKPEYELSQLAYGPLHQETTISVRQTPSLATVAMIEKIPDSWILAQGNKKYRGIKGQLPKSYNGKLGRYSWKSESFSLNEQIAKALIFDMGLTSSQFPQDDCRPIQKSCVLHAHNETLDVPDMRLEAIALFLKSLNEGREIKAASGEGAKLFTKLACAACHVTQKAIPSDAFQTVYSDMLLHFMGDGLKDPGPANLAGLWRTAPLIDNKSKAAFLHDGRGRTIEEAILWHGGDAEESKLAFTRLNYRQRQELIKFLEAL